MTRAMIDTCVIIDALQKREPFWKAAEKIFIGAAKDEFMGIITAEAVTDIYYLHHRCTHDAVRTKEVLNGLLEIFSLSDTVAADCKKALISDMADFEDAVMVETAKRISADCIVTRNLRDYKNSAIPVLSPEEFLTSMNTN